jgi:hypothetical protein
MARFEKKRQENNKNQQEKHNYKFKVLHNGFKPEDRKKMLKAVQKEDENFALQK